MISLQSPLIRILLLGVAGAALLCGPVEAEEDGLGPIEVGVAKANVEAGNQPSATLGDRDFVTELVATGTERLENPSGVITQFGLLSSGVNTEPDQNTYVKSEKNLVCSGVDYGRNFLFQGHENAGNLAYVTRINLDRKRGDARRITLLTPVGADGLTHFNALDGSTFNPFTNTLLFTEETSANVNGAINGTGSVIQISVDCLSRLTKLDPFLGLGSFEGIHPDDAGNVYLIEDASGTRPGGAARAPETGRLVPLRAAAQPNSFVYRYLPNNPARLEDGGKMQALQVSIDGQPVKFGGVGPAAAAADIISLTQKKLHTPGTSWPIKWVTIHESHKGDTQAFIATQAAKDAGATPFKRPENMTWLPESQLRSFFFSATGDTDAPTGQEPELAARGAWGSLFRVDLNHETTSKLVAKGKPRDDGIISIFFWAIRCTTRSTMLPLPTSTSCSPPRTAATPSINNSTRSIRSGRTMWTGASRWPPRFVSSPWVGTPWPRRRARKTTNRRACSSRTAARASKSCSARARASMRRAPSSPCSTGKTICSKSCART